MDLIFQQLDKKQLSDNHRRRLRERIEELTKFLFPHESLGDNSYISEELASVDELPVSGVQWTPEVKQAATLANTLAVDIADVESKTSLAFKMARAQIQKLEAHVAKRQS